MINNKQGLSEVVTTVIIVAITVAIGGFVWTVVSNLVGEQLEEGEACFGVLDQVKLNRDYTCYNTTSNRMQFSLTVGDIEIDGILVSVSYGGESKSVTLTKENQTLEDVTNYPNGNDEVKIPNKNAGQTYFFEGINTEPISIGIIPIIRNQQCGSADILREIDSCLSLAS